MPQANNPDKRINNAIVQDIKTDQYGNLWIGTFRGLNIYDGDRFYYHTPDSRDSTRISGNIVSKILQQNDSIFWIGTWDNGLNKAILHNPNDLQNGISFQQYIHNPDDSNSVSDNTIRDLYLEHHKILWAGTQGGGVNQLDLHTGIFTNTIEQSKDPVRLFSRTTLALVADSEGSVWSAGYGLSKWESGLDQMINIASPDLYYAFYTLAIDKHDHLWTITSGYILEYDPQEEHFIAYNKDDGVSDKGGSGGSQYQNEDGWIFFGRENGFDFFHPDSISSEKEIPIPVLTTLKVLNREVLVGEKDNNEGIILSKSLHYLPPITLKHDQNIFSITFAALGSKYPDSQRFQYLLDGLEGAEDNWIEVGPENREASFLGLSPGEYTFKLKVSNHDKVWNETPAELSIHILPPWWQTWPAYGIYMLITFGIIWGILRTILQRERIASQLKLQETEANSLRKLGKLKSQFFANISHEFRTPLTLILAPAKQLMQSNIDDTTKDKLSLIQRNGQRLQSLINQMLDLNQIEADKMTLKIEPGDISQHVRVICSSFHSLAEEKNITFISSVPNTEIILLYDRDKLEKILMNLLSNAFKFTPEHGKIQVSLTFEQRKGEQLTRIELEDTGPGIPSDQLLKVFDRFVQGDESTTRAYEGSGIGLALTKELVELMNGTIQVDSQISKGTRFTVTLSLAPSQAPSAPIMIRDSSLLKVSQPSTTRPEEFENLPLLLVVEDNLDMQSFLKTSLQDEYQILTADNGKSGLKTAQERIPDIILSDVMMPEMDGFAFCQAIRQMEATSHIPTILLTARAGIDSRVEGFEQGADGYLVKPFDTRELKAVVKGLLHQRLLLRKKFSRSIRVEPKGMAISLLDEQFLIKIQDFLESNYNLPTLSVEDFAQSIGFSRMQLHRKLKALTDQSAGDLIRQFRLGKAKDLLQQSGLAIAEIAYLCGFEDPAYFSKVFKQHFNQSPSAFRKNLS